MGALGVTVYGCEPDEAARFRELGPRFGVVPTITGDPPSATNVIARPRNRCVSVGHKSAICRSTLRALREAGVEYVSTRSVGLDHVDVGAARDLGLTVEAVAYAPDGVADYTLMLILMAIRHAKAVARATDAHDFRLHDVRGRDLRDMTVGVVGLGRIGTAVVRRLQGFGARVVACTNGPACGAATEFVSLRDLLVASDVVTLHVPLTPETRHLIGRPQIELMKPGAVLVNTGRGALVDTGALVAALESGALGGAALDVLEEEEGIFYVDRTASPVDHASLLRLQLLPHAIVTPHTAFHTERMLQETVENTLVNCLRFERNRPHGEAHDRDPVRRVLGGT